MKATTTSTQPRSSEGDQTGRATDFIDSIDPKRTLQLSTKAAYPILWLGTDQGHL
jgi:hypothetical protein